MDSLIDKFNTLVMQAYIVLFSVLGIILLITLIQKGFFKIGSLKYSLNEKSGIIFGKRFGLLLAYSPAQKEGHIITFGGSGLGKTSALLIPTLRAWKETAFVLDISGDITANVSKTNRIIYEPENAKTKPYNIFGSIDELSSDAEVNEELEQLALLILPEPIQDNSQNSKYFREGGRNILTSALICYYHEGMDFIPICEKIIAHNWQSLLQDIANKKNEAANRYIRSFSGANEQNNQGCKQTADNAIKLFATNEIIKSGIRRPSVNETAFTPQILETMSAFIKISEAKLELYAPLLNIITAQSLSYFSTRPAYRKNKILFCLDEFARIGKLDITNALRTLRKRNIRIFLLLQGLSDLDLIYGEAEREVMMENLDFKVILSAKTVKSQEYFAKLIGYEKVKNNILPLPENRPTYEHKEYIIEPANFGRLDNRLILIGQDKHYKLRKNYYFK